MTDQEKAATFIGWQEGRLCDRTAITNAYRERGGMRCGRCGAEIQLIPYEHEGPAVKAHLIPCPDMSDPRNYMRALHRVAEYVPWVWVCIDEGQGGSCDIEYNAPEVVSPSINAPAIHREGDNLGVAVVEALAALWDSEHKV